MTVTNEAEHMDASDLAAYVDQRLDAAERGRIEAHLADCDACRADALAALRARPRRQVPWRLIVPTLAAAAIALVVLPRFWREPVPVDTERGGSVASAIALSAPDTGTALPLGDVQLVWQATGGADYRATVTTESGAQVSTFSTRDTVAAVPAAVLQPATRYLWRVDAVLPDGTALSSTARGFAIRP